MAANYIKKEDVSTDNIYNYNYEDGAFSGDWLKFKYVDVPMDTRDPFNPIQSDNAYAVYDAYIFDTDVRDVKSLIEALSGGHSIDFFYVEESVYQGIVADDPKFLDEYSLIPYQITDKIVTVNKYYLPADFDIEDWIVPIFGTLNITLDANQNISAELQTDTDWTDKEVYAVLDGRDDYILYLKLKADSEDSTKLVFDDEYVDTTYNDTYLDENTTGTCTLQVYDVGEEENSTDYTIDYSWTNLYVEPEETVYVTPDRSYNMKIGDKFSGILYGIEITGHVLGDNLPDNETPLGIFYAKDFTNDVTYCEVSVTDGGNKSIDVNLRSEWVGHFPIEDITDWREDNTIEMALVSDANEVPGKVRIYPHFYINGQEQTNYIDNASSEENPLYSYIEFDVTNGTEELENWIAGFQNNVYLYQMDKPDTDYIINGLEWSISDLIIYYTDGTSISDLGEVQQLNLTATDDKTFSDGTNTYNLQPMEDLVTGESQEDPQV